MTKNELINKIVAKTDMYKKDCEDVINALSDVVIESLTENHGEKITLPGLGMFKVKDVPERTGKVMMGDKKGDIWVKPAHSEITFKISKSVKDI